MRADFRKSRPRQRTCKRGQSAQAKPQAAGVGSPCPCAANLLYPSHHGTQAVVSRHRSQRTQTMPTALITGITGQDGSHLAELLLDKGYRVYGMVRRSSTENFSRIEHLRDSLELVQGDLLDGVSITRLLEQIQPDEIYNLAAMSFVPTSWQQPVLTAEFTA